MGDSNPEPLGQKSGAPTMGHLISHLSKLDNIKYCQYQMIKEVYIKHSYHLPISQGKKMHGIAHF